MNTCAQKGDMLVRDIPNPRGSAVFGVQPGAAVLDAVGIMAKNGLGPLGVMAAGSMAGMLAFREVLGTVEPEAKGRR